MPFIEVDNGETVIRRESTFDNQDLVEEIVNANLGVDRKRLTVPNTSRDRRKRNADSD